MVKKITAYCAVLLLGMCLPSFAKDMVYQYTIKPRGESALQGKLVIPEGYDWEAPQQDIHHFFTLKGRIKGYTTNNASDNLLACRASSLINNNIEDSPVVFNVDCYKADSNDITLDDLDESGDIILSSSILLSTPYTNFKNGALAISGSAILHMAPGLQLEFIFLRTQ